MPDDWIKIRGPTPTEKKIFEIKAKTKYFALLVLLLIVLIAILYVIPFLTQKPLPKQGSLGELGALCKTSADCGNGLCCGGYIAQTGPNSGYATCRDKTKYACFD